MSDREQELEAAIVAFLTKWELVLPAITGAFFMMQNHGMPYEGPTLEPELNAFKALVAGRTSEQP